MEHHLSFERLVSYDAGESGITVNTTLKFTDKSVSVQAKIDTGSTFCIFERRFGEQLGLKIEDGLFQRIGTATGVFATYGFRLTL